MYEATNLGVHELREPSTLVLDHFSLQSKKQPAKQVPNFSNFAF